MLQCNCDFQHGENKLCIVWMITFHTSGWRSYSSAERDSHIAWCCFSQCNKHSLCIRPLECTQKQVKHSQFPPEKGKSTYTVVYLRSPSSTKRYLSLSHQSCQTGRKQNQLPQRTGRVSRETNVSEI